jgi:PAS domain S-box-containing protein
MAKADVARKWGPVRAQDATDAGYRSMVEFAPAYFYQASVDVAQTLYRSPQAEAILGYSEADWIADPDLWVKILHPDDRVRVLAEFSAGVSGKKPFRAQYRIITKSGEMIWVRDHAATIPNPSGPGMIVQGVVLDVTDQVGAEQAVMRAELERVAMSRFLGAMSHEFRTPLNSIIGFAELMAIKESDPLTQRQRRHLLNILSSGNHLLELVNELLDLTRVQAGEVTLTMVPLALKVAVKRAIDAVQPLAAEKGLWLVGRVADDLRVEADASRLHQVLLNLLSNAIKFTPNGFVEVTACADGDSVSLVVTDSGIGIAEADQKRVFDEFVQVGPDHQNAQVGTGLGLSLARRLVEAMGGSVTVTSKPGEGSTFTVRLRRA